MAPPLNKEQEAVLNRIFYEDKMLFGRDKLYQFIRANHDIKISRRQVWNWLSSQEINQLHRQHVGAKDIKSTLMKKPHQQLAIDLVDMQNFQVKGFKYLLNGVDLFSRKLYSVAIKNKEDKTVLAGFKKIKKEIGHVGSIRSDNGSEFIAQIFKEYLASEKISQVLSKAHAPQSNGGIERANQTLKRLIHKNVELEDGFDWVANLAKLVQNINKTIIDGKKNHTADDIEGGGAELLEEVHELDKKSKASTLPDKPHEVGDRVRIYQPSEKMKSRQWSPEIYAIIQVFKPRTSYGIFEYKLDEFTTKFKHEDLQKVNGEVQNQLVEPKRYVISSIVKQVKKDKKIYYEVRWKGFSKAQNTDEPRENLMQDVPKMLQRFEKTM